MKPFTAALALDLGRINTNTQFETGNGAFRYQGSTIHDVSRNGTLTVAGVLRRRSEEHTSELQSLMRISYAVFCLKKKNIIIKHRHSYQLTIIIHTIRTTQ